MIEKIAIHVHFSKGCSTIFRGYWKLVISEAFPTKANPNKEKYNVPGFYNHMKQFIMVPPHPWLGWNSQFLLGVSHWLHWASIWGWIYVKRVLDRHLKWLTHMANNWYWLQDGRSMELLSNALTHNLYMWLKLYTMVASFQACLFHKSGSCHFLKV